MTKGIRIYLLTNKQQNSTFIDKHCPKRDMSCCFKAVNDCTVEHGESEHSSITDARLQGNAF